MLPDIYFLFRLCADLAHIQSKRILLTKILSTKSCSGLSFKTQFLYLVVFISRYLDLFELKILRKTTFMQAYLFLMKSFYIIFSATIIYLMKFSYFYSTDNLNDTFNLKYISPLFIISLFFKDKTKTVSSYLVEYLYTFSILLESMAIIPQMVMLNNTQECETFNSEYIMYLGLYRLLYVISWVFKIFAGKKIEILVLICGVVQSLLYIDFFISYYRFVYKERGNRISRSKN
ncbi:ER lumen protein-retaining receptor 2 [Cucumispora dikerogammari]|nr:ER lumen protein-retaining receptor 2 [Cucumispora dikerogammari]